MSEILNCLLLSLLALAFIPTLLLAALREDSTSLMAPLSMSVNDVPALRAAGAAGDAGAASCGGTGINEPRPERFKGMAKF